MLWTRRRAGGEESRGRHRAGSASARVASRPPAVEPVPPLHPQPATAVRPPAGSGVHLGFADGSAVELAAEDPRTAAFRAVARTLRG